MGAGSTLLPAPIAHPQVADLSLAGCSPAEPDYVLIGTANIDHQDQQHNHFGRMPIFSNSRT